MGNENRQNPAVYFDDSVAILKRTELIVRWTGESTKLGFKDPTHPPILTEPMLYNPVQFINFLISSYNTRIAAAPVLLNTFDIAPR